jgi:hypothetical protein
LDFAQRARSNYFSIVVPVVHLCLNKEAYMAYIVKSINLNNQAENVSLNVRLFKNHDDAEKFMRSLEKQISEDSDSEWFEIEELDCE